MKRTGLVVLTVLVPLLALAGSFSWLPDAPAPGPRAVDLIHGLRINLEPAEQTVKVGDVVNFKVVFLNQGPDPIRIVRPLDGSEARWQQPYHDFIAKRNGGEARRWSLLGGRPARMAALSAADVIVLKKGESADPRQGPYAEYLKTVSFRDAGTYQVWYLYVFERVNDSHDIDGTPADVSTALRGIFTSNAVKVIAQ